MVQCAHLEKYEFVKVNGKDDIPYMKWKKMFETTNQRKPINKNHHLK
jgi:hypothetical protein